MPSQELTDWRAYEQIEPFGEMRADLRAARICEVIAMSAGAKGDDQKPFPLDTFLLTFDLRSDEEKSEAEADAQLAKAEAFRSRLLEIHAERAALKTPARPIPTPSVTAPIKD